MESKLYMEFLNGINHNQYYNKRFITIGGLGIFGLSQNAGENTQRQKNKNKNKNKNPTNKEKKKKQEE